MLKQTTPVFCCLTFGYLDVFTTLRSHEGAYAQRRLPSARIPRFHSYARTESSCSILTCVCAVVCSSFFLGVLKNLDRVAPRSSSTYQQYSLIGLCTSDYFKYQVPTLTIYKPLPFINKVPVRFDLYLIKRITVLVFSEAVCE